MSGNPPPGPAPVSGGAGGSSGGTGYAEQPAPQPFEPKIEAPKFDGKTGLEAGAILMMISMLQRYYQYLVRKGMSAARAVEHVATQCMIGTAMTWSMTTEFIGTWEDFEEKFCARFLPDNQAERAGHTLMYATYQNDSSIHDYNAAFVSALNMCALVGFAVTAHVLLVAYKRGLNAASKAILVLCPLPLPSYQECMAYLVQADAKLVGNLLGSQPRDYKKSNSKSHHRDGNSGHHNNNNNSNNNGNGGMNAANSSHNGAPRDSTANRGSGASSSGAARGNDRRGPRDFSKLDCNRCGVRGHIASDCRSDLSVVEAFRSGKQKK